MMSGTSSRSTSSKEGLRARMGRKLIVAKVRILGPSSVISFKIGKIGSSGEDSPG